MIGHLLGFEAVAIERERWERERERERKLKRSCSTVNTYLPYLPTCYQTIFLCFCFWYIRKTTSHKRDLLPVFSCSLLTVTHCCLLLVVVVVEVAQGQCSVA